MPSPAGPASIVTWTPPDACSGGLPQPGEAGVSVCRWCRWCLGARGARGFVGGFGGVARGGGCGEGRGVSCWRWRRWSAGCRSRRSWRWSRRPSSHAVSPLSLPHPVMPRRRARDTAVSASECHRVASTASRAAGRGRGGRVGCVASADKVSRHVPAASRFRGTFTGPVVPGMLPGLGLLEDLAQLLGDLLRRIATQCCDGQVLRPLPIFTLQRQRGGAAVEHGARRLASNVGLDQVGGLGLAVEGAAKRRSRCFTVALASQEEHRGSTSALPRGQAGRPARDADPVMLECGGSAVSGSLGDVSLPSRALSLGSRVQVGCGRRRRGRWFRRCVWWAGWSAGSRSGVSSVVRRVRAMDGVCGRPKMSRGGVVGGRSRGIGLGRRRRRRSMGGGAGRGRCCGRRWKRGGRAGWMR
jgi:hypothetical protein